MTFHICPLHPRAQKLLQDAPEAIKGKRIPIARRAEVLARNRLISFAAARECWNKESFELGGNQFELHNSSAQVDCDLVALIISHLGSIFEKAKVAISITDDDGFPTIVLRAFNTSAGKISGDAILSMKFSLQLTGDDAVLTSHFLESRQKNLGGKSRAALYNLAKDLNLKRIEFPVIPANFNAQRFFFHIDFGVPMEDAPDPFDPETWVVNLK